MCLNYTLTFGTQKYAGESLILTLSSSVVDLILSTEMKFRKENILNVSKQLQLKTLKY